MKKLFFVFLLLLISISSFSQKWEYYGPINKEILFKLTPTEKLLYIYCIRELRMETTDFSWANETTLKNLKKNMNYYIGLSANISTKDEKAEIFPIVGKHKVCYEQFVFYIKRTKKDTTIKVMMLY
jgi:hypothetical protein